MRKNTERDLHIFDNAYNNKYKSPLIKWYQTSMSYEEKYRLGLLTYAEYQAWQAELAAQAASDNSSDTFWKNDDEIRENISSDDYSDFLSANSIDVSNKTNVDFDSLYAQINGDSDNKDTSDDIVYLTQEEILANVNRDIHGGNTILSEAEIAALFEAANQNQ